MKSIDLFKAIAIKIIENNNDNTKDVLEGIKDLKFLLKRNIRLTNNLFEKVNNLEQNGISTSKDNDDDDDKKHNTTSKSNVDADLKELFNSSKNKVRSNDFINEDSSNYTLFDIDPKSLNESQKKSMAAMFSNVKNITD